MSLSESHTSGSNPAPIQGRVSEWGNGAGDNERYLSARWARPSSTDAKFSVFEQSCWIIGSLWHPKASHQLIITVYIFVMHFNWWDNKFLHLSCLLLRVALQALILLLFRERWASDEMVPGIMSNTYPHIELAHPPRMLNLVYLSKAA